MRHRGPETVCDLIGVSQLLLFSCLLSSCGSMLSIAAWALQSSLLFSPFFPTSIRLFLDCVMGVCLAGTVEQAAVLRRQQGERPAWAWQTPQAEGSGGQAGTSGF